MDVDVAQRLDEVDVGSLAVALVPKNIETIEHRLEISSLKIVRFLFHFLQNGYHFLLHFLRLGLQQLGHQLLHHSDSNYIADLMDFMLL